LEVVKRSKSARATYSVYLWNRVTPPGKPATSEWSAEFNAGNLHRVETPRDRVVANCAQPGGFAISLPTGGIQQGPAVAGYACGINTDKPFLATAWKGIVHTKFGDADHVRVVDADNIRDYDVTKEGLIVGSVYAANQPGEAILLRAEAVAVLHDLPERDMFDRHSLGRSYVPERFRSEGRPPPDQSGKH
jgi:hypothetical protein